MVKDIDHVNESYEVENYQRQIFHIVRNVRHFDQLCGVFAPVRITVNVTLAF